MKLIANRGLVTWVNDDGSPAERGMRSAGDPFPMHAKFFCEHDAEEYLRLRRICDKLTDGLQRIAAMTGCDQSYAAKILTDTFADEGNPQ